MKKIIYFLAFNLLFLTAYSQRKAANSSPAYVAGKPYFSTDSYMTFYLKKGNKILSLKWQDKTGKLQRLDVSKLAFIGEKEYEYAISPYFPKGMYMEGFNEINNRCYFFFSLWDKVNKKEQLFANEIDFDKGEFIGQPQLLMQVDGKVKDPKFRKFETIVSSDGKTALIKYERVSQVSDDKKNFDVIGLASFDADLKKNAVREIKMPYTERRMKKLDYHIDNKGDVYILAKVFHDDSEEDKKSKSDTEANYHMEILTIMAGSDKIVSAKLDDKDKFINNLQLFEAPKSSGVLAGGYYSNGKGKNFEENCDGVITFKVKDNGSLTDKNYFDIPVEVINQYESGKVIRKNERKEENGEGAKFTFLKLKNLKMLDDGSIALVGEQYIENTQNSNVGRGGSVTTVKYNDILVTKINPDGKLGWMRKIPKQQFGPVANDITFKFLNTSSDLFILYLDNIKNIDLAPDQEPARHLNGEGGYLTTVKMSLIDGATTKTSLFNTREIDSFQLQRFPYSNAIDFADNSFLIEAPKGKTEKVMVKITLE